MCWDILWAVKPLPRIDSALADGEKAAGYIFMAAPARDLAAMMREQYDFLYSF